MGQRFIRDWRQGEIDLGVKLKALGPGKFIIKFRITTNNIYIKSNDVEIEIK